MKRTSFVCFGAQGSKDSLVYQEIPGRDGGEEFFLFFSPGEPTQEPLLRTLFREAVSTSRLGAPTHYFSRFIDQFKAHAGSGEGDAIAGALIMIQIRRGDDVHLLFNRDAALVHWSGGAGWQSPTESLRGFSEIPMGGVHDQGDLFRRSAEDLFVLGQFSLTNGEHTLILAPSREFIAEHAESLRNSVFFPSFEFPREMGIELAIARSFPALHWKSGAEEARTAQEPRPASRAKRVTAPLVAGALTVAAALFILFGPAMKHHSSRDPGEAKPLLAAADPARDDTVAATGLKRNVAEGKRASAAGVRDTELSLAEAWKRNFKSPITSSPRVHEGRVYFGGRDGFFYSFTPAGELAWKYRSGAGIGASPCCVPGRVIGANYRGDVFCLDAKTGRALWSFATRSKIVSTPATGGDILVVGTTDGRLVALRLTDARKLWEKKLGLSIRTNPVVGTNYIIAVTGDGAVFRLDHRGAVVWKTSPGGGAASSPLCREERDLLVFGTRNGEVHGCALSSGKRTWRYATGSAVDGSPSSSQDELYFGTKGGDLIALALDGTPLWRCGVGGAVHSRPAIAGKVVLVTTYASRLVAVDAGSGRVVAEYRAASPIYSSPEFDGKRIYFGSNAGTFHAIWLKAPVAS